MYLPEVKLGVETRTEMYDAAIGRLFIKMLNISKRTYLERKKKGLEAIGTSIF